MVLRDHMGNFLRGKTIKYAKKVSVAEGEAVGLTNNLNGLILFICKMAVSRVTPNFLECGLLLALLSSSLGLSLSSAKIIFPAPHNFATILVLGATVLIIHQKGAFLLQQLHLYYL